jgi:hypothetical protein
MNSGDSSKSLGPPKVPHVAINSPEVNQAQEEEKKPNPKSSNSAPKKLTENVGSATGKILTYKSDFDQMFCLALFTPYYIMISYDV